MHNVIIKIDKFMIIRITDQRFFLKKKIEPTNVIFAVMHDSSNVSSRMLVTHLCI